MVLRITDSPEDFGFTDFKISLSEFGDKMFHPMIATTKWEKVYIDVNARTPRGFIYQLVRRGTKIVPNLTEGDSISMKALSVLFEIFPDNVASLQANYLKGAACLREYVNSLVKE